MKNKLTLIIATVATFAITGCDNTVRTTSDQVQNRQQEDILKECASQVGMPAIKNFREKKLLKDILEMRDQDGLTTYTYIVAENTGKLIFLGESIGYGIPYATQYTSPMRPAKSYETYEQGNVTIPQADPNGLYSPASCDGTWVLLKDPNSNNVKPVYIEPRIIVSPFKLPNT
jgi:hypothetical protein